MFPFPFSLLPFLPGEVAFQGLTLTSPLHALSQLVNTFLCCLPPGHSMCQFGNSPAGEHFWRGTRAVVVCVDGQSSNCGRTAARWLTGPVIAECRKYEPNAIICLLATKADSFSERRINVIDRELQAFVDQRLCSTWAQVSAKAMTGKPLRSPMDSSIRNICVVPWLSISTQIFT